MNPFESDLRELVTRWREAGGVALEELVQALDEVVEELVEEVNSRAA